MNTMTMTMTMTVNHFQFEAKKALRILMIAMVLTVGALQVSQCSNDDDSSTAAQDQYDRMHN